MSSISVSFISIADSAVFLRDFCIFRRCCSSPVGASPDSIAVLQIRGLFTIYTIYTISS